MHDSDGSGDCHWVPGRGIIDWKSFIIRLHEMDFKGMRILEVVNKTDTPDETIAEGSAVVKQWTGMDGKLLAGS